MNQGGRGRGVVKIHHIKQHAQSRAHRLAVAWHMSCQYCDVQGLGCLLMHHWHSVVVFNKGSWWWLWSIGLFPGGWQNCASHIYLQVCGHGHSEEVSWGIQGAKWLVCSTCSTQASSSVASEWFPQYFPCLGNWPDYEKEIALLFGQAARLLTLRNLKGAKVISLQQDFPLVLSMLVCQTFEQSESN